MAGWIFQLLQGWDDGGQDQYLGLYKEVVINLICIILFLMVFKNFQFVSGQSWFSLIGFFQEDLGIFEED